MKKLLPFAFVMIPLLFGFISHLKQLSELPGDSNTWFSGSGLCVMCHDSHDIAMRDSDGHDVSPVSQWRSTMLANASKDPFWRAKVRHEGLVNPSHKEGLENVCTRCHAPMGMINAFMNESGDYTLAQLDNDDIGKDGISCTVCHQIDDFSSPAFSGTFDINRHKEIYGPYPDPVAQQMFMNTGYTPVYNDQINNSRLCGSCHTLFTNSVFDDGSYTGETFVEQALYHEWVNSVFPDQNKGCQTCHMPRIDEPIKITSRPLFLPGRQPYGQHTFIGGNVFMLQLMRDNHDELGLHSSQAFLQKTIDRTRQLLTEETLDLDIGDVVTRDDTVYIEVILQNKAGHKFPTGFPSRRAYLEFVVTRDNDTLFHSGKAGSAALTRFDINYFEPHYEVINSEEQVQIYEFVMGNTRGEVTTVLERAHIPLKDNRLVPRGFSESHFNYDTVKVVGRATTDADYFSGQGIDRIIYAIPQKVIGSDAMVRVALHYETVPESWLQEMFAYADEDEDIARFREMYGASDKTPIEVASDTKMIITTSNHDINQPNLRIYPNPSSGKINLDGLQGFGGYVVYTMDGKQVTHGTLGPGKSQLYLNLPFGQYLFVVFSRSVRQSMPLVIAR